MILRRPRPVLALLLSLIAAGAAAGTPAAAAARVPQGFAGIVIDGPMWPTAAGIDLDHQLDVMVGTGVETVRVQVDWHAIQPYRTWAEVPAADRSQFTDADGLPLALGPLDALVGACAERGLRLLPLVTDAPDWDAIDQGRRTLTQTPRDTAPYARFLAALIGRYGPHGSLWAARSARLPLRTWEVWNEPDIGTFWATQPNFAPSYVRLLRAAHDAIKRADPHATVVLGGLANRSWTALATVLRVPGASRLFDLAAVHPYTRYPAGVITIVRRFRTALDAGGARHASILVDEFGWNSSLGLSPEAFGIETTPAGQARNVDAVIRLLAGARVALRLAGIDYYDWAGPEAPGMFEFAFAGLFRFDGGSFIAKPVLRAYRRDVLGLLERCARKASTATRCAQPS